MKKKVETVMVNNLTNINKMNNGLSPQPINHKKTTTYDIEKPGHVSGQAQQYGGVKPVDEILTCIANIR